MAQVPATRRNQGAMAPRRLHPLERLHRDFDTLFDRLMTGSMAPFEPEMELMRVWDFGVTENDKEIAVRAELPGFEENEIDIQMSNNILTIRAEKEQRGDQQEEYRSFVRSLTLPSGIDAEKAQATYRNGVLELHIPRAQGAQPRRIRVQGQGQEQGQGQQALSGQSENATQSGEGNGAGQSRTQDQQIDATAAGETNK